MAEVNAPPYDQCGLRAGRETAEAEWEWVWSTWLVSDLTSEAEWEWVWSTWLVCDLLQRLSGSGCGLASV